MVNPRPFLIGAGRIVFLTGISISVAITSAVAQAGNTPNATAVADGEDATVRADLAFDVVSMQARSQDTGRDHVPRWRCPRKATNIGPSESRWGFTVQDGLSSRQAGPGGRVHRSAELGVERQVRVRRQGGRRRSAPSGKRFSWRGLHGAEPNAWKSCCRRLWLTAASWLVHHVPAQVDGYALVVANHGPNREETG